MEEYYIETIRDLTGLGRVYCCRFWERNEKSCNGCPAYNHDLPPMQCLLKDIVERHEIRMVSSPSLEQRVAVLEYVVSGADKKFARHYHEAGTPLNR
jgi:hypothetical protein